MNNVLKFRMELSSTYNVEGVEASMKLLVSKYGLNIVKNAIKNSKLVTKNHAVNNYSKAYRKAINGSSNVNIKNVTFDKLQQLRNSNFNYFTNHQYGYEAINSFDLVSLDIQLNE